MQTTNPQECRGPIWVKDPKTNKEIDVAAFFQTLDELDASGDIPVGQGGVSVLDKVLRVLNLTEFNPMVHSPGQLVDLYYDLHRLKIMFEATRTR